jgi:hypothetical protein
MPRRYSAPPVAALRRAPSRHLQPEQAAVSAPAFPRSTQTQQPGLTSPPCRAPPGQKLGHPPGSSQDRFYDPGFDAISGVFDTSPANRLRSSSRSPPGALTAHLSPTLTTTVSSQCSSGWFAVSPQRATSRATTLIICAAPHRARSAYSISTSLSALVAHRTYSAPATWRLKHRALKDTAAPGDRQHGPDFEVVELSYRHEGVDWRQSHAHPVGHVIEALRWTATVRWTHGGHAIHDAAHGEEPGPTDGAYLGGSVPA